MPLSLTSLLLLVAILLPSSAGKPPLPPSSGNANTAARCLFEPCSSSKADIKITHLSGTKVIAEIRLRSGWSLISLPVLPDDARLATIFKDVAAFYDTDDRMYDVAKDTGDFEVWEPTKAYRIHTRRDVTFRIIGEPIFPEKIRILLKKGWNLIPYLRTQPMPVSKTLASVSDRLVLAKDQEGAVYHPGYGLDGIGELHPGQSYQIHVDAETELVYPKN